MASKKMTRRQKIQRRIRKKISGTSLRPRMAVYRSNAQIYVQLIDDIAKRTLLSASSREAGISDMKITKKEKAALVGNLIAKKALEIGINTVSFDRSGYLYHGRIRSLADGARGERKEDGTNEFLQF
jgi:large subunit ribosomal protein L18